MADERRAHDYDVALATVAYLGAAVQGKLRPAEMNPYRAEPPREKTPEQKAEESEEGWGLLKAGLEFLVKTGGRGAN